MSTEQALNPCLEVGKKLVALCQEGKNLEAINTLYADDIESVEVCGDENMPQVMKGIDAIRGKTQWWYDNHEVHGGSCDGPYPNGDDFICIFEMDITPKAGPMAGKRFQMKEAARYTVKDGKIAREEFYYDVSGFEC